MVLNAAIILGEIASTEGALQFSGRTATTLSKLEREAFLKEVQPVLQNPLRSLACGPSQDVYIPSPKDLPRFSERCNSICCVSSAR
ncbi:ABC-type oligopeptide transport system ATPase subunit [Rhizobium leguminosarum]|uniref:ABC-type oligopeptide transport system ATPase subunit n=1 Tax=Rhizobium esperanzae TaxID=1967781 RepID=A0A7W6XYP3_9HYPH|nr:ABC-type oligopeptide transport system ATPase subunit [Rhizobium esperanzae]MDH6204618.1 ABC-type oligopeptide transport system ATPase subunit [Rhizobium leguminosarum]